MSRILYVFPHPDDESFGPSPAIVRHRSAGHEVHLLTLTRGEATRQRLQYGYSLEQMGEVRLGEMEVVARLLDLTSMEVLDLPDGQLAHINPIVLEELVAERIERIRPDVLVTYAVHGISGHPDHLVTHAVVKRLFCEPERRNGDGPKRLALFTLRGDDPARPAHLRASPDEAIDCIMRPDASELERATRALHSYVTYMDVIRAHDPLGQVAGGICFELFQEHHDPPLEDFLDGLGR
jgi:N-acetylglucosamine malate deacetylase 2